MTQIQRLPLLNASQNANCLDVMWTYWFCYSETLNNYDTLLLRPGTSMHTLGVLFQVMGLKTLTLETATQISIFRKRSATAVSKSLQI